MVVSIMDKKDNKSIIDHVIFDINAKYKGFDRKVFSVDIECNDSRVTTQSMHMIQPLHEAFGVLHDIIIFSLPNICPVMSKQTMMQQ